MKKKDIIKVLKNLPLTHLKLFNGDNVVCVKHTDIIKEIHRLRTIRLSDIEPYHYFKYNQQILQLIKIDLLDQFAVSYNHLTGETTNLGQYQLVEPISVQIVEINNC